MPHHIHLVGRDQHFDAHEGETLLMAATRAGVPLPNGCRVGACLTCAARLHEGHVALPPGSALTPAHLQQNLVLLCIAEARSDLQLEVGERVGLLPPLPWTD
jgi:ferredoxin